MEAMDVRRLTEEPLKQIPLGEIGDRYMGLRIIVPSAEVSMAKSLAKYGQLSPVVVCRHEGGYELIDGFKRFRAGRKLDFAFLLARELEASPRVHKAAIIQFNRVGSSISALEEALVVQALYRDDGLTQEEIGILIGRHKSWVNRRLSLVERLCEEALAGIRLGLVSPSHGRELSKLPRGNQEAALETLLKYRLSCHETECLVGLLLLHPRWDHERILKSPELFQTAPPAPPGTRDDLSTAGADIRRKLLSLKQRCETVSARLEAYGSELGTDDLRVLSPLIASVLRTAQSAVEHLKRALVSGGQGACK